MFRLRIKHKTTWMHPRSKHWHLIDYATVRQRDISQVQITCVMRSAHCWTDHHLAVTKLNLRLCLPRKSGKEKLPLLNVDKFQNLEFDSSSPILWLVRSRPLEVRL